MNTKVYIHELIDIIGHNRAKYMHHMTANWCPVAREERNQLCFGVWGTVGSTGHWPEVVNLWELDGWDGLVANFAHEMAGGAMQDPSLAEWWAVAAGLRRGGVDRILVPEPWTEPITSLTSRGVRGAVYAHELVALPPGRAGRYLELLASQGVALVSAVAGAELVGAFRVAMVNESECVVIWALPSWEEWGVYEQAWLPGGALSAWRDRLAELGADWKRTALVDAPLSPLRAGRQPQIEDRRPLSEI